MKKLSLLILFTLSLISHFSPVSAGNSPDISTGVAPDNCVLTLSQCANQAMNPGDNAVKMVDGKALLNCSMQAVNATIDGDGLKVSSTSSSEGAGEFSLAVSSFGRTDRLQNTSSEKGQISSDEKIVRLSRSGIVEEFSTSADGVRQDFIVNSSPKGDGQLLINLELSGAKVSASGTRLLITLPSGRELAYSRLNVTDASGKTLAAGMKPLSPTSIGITVNDSGAAYPIRIDPTISDADWASVINEVPGTNGTVYAMAYKAGALYVGGAFNAVKDIAANNIAKGEWDGSTWTWSAFGKGTNGPVKSLVFDPSGNLYIGGLFSNAGDVWARNVAKWDGAKWNTLGNGMDNSVDALACDTSGNLYAGGSFSWASGVSANRIAKWNGSSWSAVGSGMNYSVAALTFDSLGNLYAGGWFTTAGGVSANRIAKWNGSSWSALGSGMEREVLSLAIDSSGDLYAGGFFSTAGGVSANHIARWHESAWYPLGNGREVSVKAIAFDPSGNLYAGAYRDKIAKCSNPSTSPDWTELGTGTDNYVYALACNPAGDVFVGGNFTKAGGLSANNIAKWDGTWTAFGTGMNLVSGNLYDNIERMTFDHLGNLYVFGHFTTAGNVFANYLAKWDGTNWSALGSGLADLEYSYVNAMTCDSVGNLYVGGWFSLIGGVSAKNVARWDGVKWNALGSGTSSSVYALEFDSSGNLYVGGWFDTAGGVSAKNIAKCSNPSTSPVWSALGTGTNNRVKSLLFNSPDLYVGGDFTTAGTVPVKYVAKWNGSWSALGAGTTSNVTCLAWDPVRSLLYAGDSYTGGISKWNGSAWSALSPGLSNYWGGDMLTSLLCDLDGNLYAAGNFATAGAVSANRIAMWNPATSSWSALGSGMDNQVCTLAFDTSKENLYAGGSFIKAGDKYSPYLAKCVIPKNQVNLTMAKSGDGTTSPTAGTTTKVNLNRDISIKATPTAGNDFKGWTAAPGNDVTFGNANLPSTTVKINSGNATVTANFAIATNTITASAGAGGSISPSGRISVNYYASKSFTITPDLNYHISDVLVDGASVGAVSSYNFTNVKAPHTIDASFAINTNTVTFVEGANGTIRGTKVQTPGYGLDCTAVEAVPNANYDFVNWTGPGFIATTTNPLTLTNVTSGKTITANFAHSKADLTMAMNGTGTTTPAVGTTSSINTATPVSIKATPAATSAFINWTVSGGASVANPNSANTTATLTADGTVTAKFADGAVLTMAKTGSGTISPVYGANNVLTGAPVNISATPDTGYRFVGWTVSDPLKATVIDAGAASTIATISGSATITANFEIIKNTITVIPGLNGTINPAGPSVSVDYNKSQTFTIAAAANCRVVDVKVDDISVGAVTSYTLANVKSNHTISATFELAKANLTVAKTGNGTVTPASGMVSTNTPIAIKATPAANSAFSYWTSTPGATVANPDFASTTVTLTEAATVTANFTDGAVLTMGKLGNGTVTPATGPVLINTPVTINATPLTGNDFVRWSSTGGATVTAPDSANTTVTLTGNGSVTANFAVTTYKITSSAGASGNISPLGDVSVNYGTSKSYTITPATNYRVADVLVDGISVGAVTIYNFTNVKSNHTISATFELAKANLTVAKTGNGTVTPATGMVSTNTPIAIKATPAANSAFSYWTSTPGATVANPNSASTTVTLTEAATVTANFTDGAVLTMGKLGNGTVTPATGPVLINSPITISATPLTGNEFVSWSSTGGATVAAPDSASTTVTLTGNGSVTANFAVTTYTITANVFGDGKIAPYGNVSVNYGTSKSFTITPAPNYHVDAVFVDANLIGAVTSYNFTNIKGNHNIDAFFAINTNTVTFIEGANGTIKGEKIQKVDYNLDCIAVEAIPNENYDFLNWTGTGLAIPSTENPLTITNVTSPRTITANFTHKKADLTMAAVTNGTTTPVGKSSVNTATPVPIKATPKAGYAFEKWVVDDPLKVIIGSETSASTTISITGPVTVTANFVGGSVLTMAKVGNGTIFPAVGTSNVATSIPPSLIVPFDISATPDVGYKFVNWTVSGGASVADPLSPSTTATLTAAGKVTANFAMITYAITASAGEFGTITPSGTVSVNSGTAKSFTIAPALNYRIADVLVDGVSVGAVTSYNFTNINASHTIAASFTIKTNTVTFVEGANGTISDPKIQTVDWGKNCETVTANPDPNYQFVNWTGTGFTTSTNPSLTLTNVKAPMTITANFAHVKGELIMASDINGTTTPAAGSKTIVNTATPIPIKATPKPGYAFDHWLILGDATIPVEEETSANANVTINSGSASATASFHPGSFLTMAKVGNGTVTPASGLVVAGNRIDITAKAANGYHFNGWTSNKPDTLFDDFQLPSTKVIISGAATVTANFAQNINKLMMLTSGEGTVTPVTAGFVDKYTLTPVAITAIPATNWHFVKWTLVSGSATIANPAAASTTVTLTGNDGESAEVQAEFARDTTTLTMAVKGSGGISGSVSEGTNTVDTKTAISIIASPAAGSHFINWTSTGGAVVANPNSDTTTVSLTTPGTVTANFAIYDYTAVFTTDGNGTVIGTSPQTAHYGDKFQPVKAIPSTNYHFVNWTGTGGFIPTSDNPLTAVADQAADMLITANFARNQGFLTVDHTGTGSVSGEGTFDTKTPQNITATDMDPDNFEFVNWTISGAGSIADPSAMDTTVTLNGHDGCTAIATAHFFPFNTNVLTSGITVTPALDGAIGDRLIYRINVPPGTTRLFVKTENGGVNDDCDLYVRKGMVPSIEEYDYRSTNVGTYETVNVLNPDPADWYIMVYGYTSFTGVDLTATLYSDVPDVPTGLSATQNLPDKVTLTWNATFMKPETSGYDIYRSNSNSPDLAALIGSVGTGILTYDDMTALPGTLYYYWVRGKTLDGSSAYSYSAQGGLDTGVPIKLSNGMSVTVSGDAGTTKQYTLDVPAGQCLLEVRASAGTGDCDLTVYLDTGVGYDSSSLRYGVKVTDNEIIRIDNPVESTCVINLYANTAYTGLTLMAKYFNTKPLPPATVNASDGSYAGAIEVSWKDSDGATGYEVWRSATTNSSSAVKLADVCGLSYVDIANTEKNPLSFNATYYYFIKAKNTAGTSAFSANNSGYLARIPAAPATVTVSKSAYFEKISLSWPAVSGATSYKLYRNTSGVFSEGDYFVKVGYVSNNANYSYDDYGGPDPMPNTDVPDQKYYYWVKSANDNGASAPVGGYGTLKRNGPATITASQGTLSERIRVSWAPVCTNLLISYDLYCDNVPAVPAIQDTMYEYIALDTSVHQFKVKANYNGYTGDFSATCSGYAQNSATILPPPKLKSVIGESLYVIVSWGEVPLANSYNVYRKINDADPWVLIDNVQQPGSTVSYYDFSALPDEKYMYAVTTVNAIGQSAMSTPMSGGLVTEILKWDPAKLVTGAYKSEQYFQFLVQPGCSRLVITLTPLPDATGNCDLYTKLGSYPTITNYNAKGVSGIPPGGETITITNPASGIWYIMLYGEYAYSNFELSAAYYYATDIVLTEVPANDQTIPFTATFKGKVQDETLTGIAGLTVGVRNPTTGLTYWIPTKTDAGGNFTYSTTVTAEGEYTFDFTLSSIPDFTTSIASHTVTTRLNAGGIFDFAGYLPCKTIEFIPDFVWGFEDYMNARRGFAEGPPINLANNESMWVRHTLWLTPFDEALKAKLDSGLYILYYGSEGTAVGNCGTKLPEELGFKTTPLLVHVAYDRQVEVMDALKANGVIDDTLINNVKNGGIGVVAVAGVSNPWGEEFGGTDYDISLTVNEQYDILANIAGQTPGAVTVFGTEKMDETIIRSLHVRIDDGTREIGVKTSSFIEKFVPVP